MIVCSKCGKENQDHYKFCLGCGAELPRDAAPKKFGGPFSGPAAGAVGQIVDEGTSLGFGPEQDNLSCPQCAFLNPFGNKFCASCGFRLSKGGGGPNAGPSAPPAAAPAPAAPSVVPSGPAGAGGSTAVHLTALRADGSEAGEFTLPNTPMTIGRDTGGIFAGDSYLSPKHATFAVKGEKITIRDESSLNGIYRKIKRDVPVQLGMGDIFRIGQEILRVEPLSPAAPSPDGVERLGSPAKGYVARMALVIGRDATGNAYPIPETGLHLGRERGEVLFPEDGYVSGLHCKISSEAGKLYVTDLGSSNGSFVRLMKETVLTNGDILLMGQQLFRVNNV